MYLKYRLHYAWTKDTIEQLSTSWRSWHGWIIGERKGMVKVLYSCPCPHQKDIQDAKKHTSTHSYPRH
jgi:hypothetical protein